MTCAACALLLLPGCDSQKPDAKSSAPVSVLEKTAEKGPVKLTVRFSPKEPRLSDYIDLDVIVSAPENIKITPPPFGKSVGEFLINDYTPNPAPKTENGVSTRDFHYKLEPVRSGQHLIGSIGVEFKDAAYAASVSVVETDPIDITVVPPDLGAEAPNLAKLAEMNAPLPLPKRPLSAAAWALIAGVALALAAFAIYWRRRGGGPVARQVVKSPEEIAREELDALLRENLPALGQFKEFYVRITGVVRRYIERTTGIRAPEQTTEEFLRDVHFRKVYAVERAERLAQFLEAADMVKYAGLQPGARQVEEAIARAQEFVGLSSAFAPMPG